jgi:hypothetical protein
MYFIPLKLKKAFSINPNPNPGRNFWGVVDSAPYLKVLGLEDLFDDVYILSIWVRPNTVTEIHKDHKLDKSGVKWSMIVPLVLHDNISIEVFNQTSQSGSSTCISMAGDNPIPFLDEVDTELVDSWNVDKGSFVFDAYNHWHRIRNDSSEFRNIISIRSTNLEFSEVLKRYPLL